MATTVATSVEAQQSPSTVETTSTPISDSEEIDSLPKLLQRSNTVHNPGPGFSNRHRSRHSKKLSLNFPIPVLPHDTPLTTNGSLSSISQSPIAGSPYKLSTPTSARPVPSPEEKDESGSLDFLTLIAGQERRVLELREELEKAEAELLGFKKQWSLFEANKKRAELRTKSVKLGPVTTLAASRSAEDEDLERMKRREAREKKIKELTSRETGHDRPETVNGNAKRKILAGRHTRTLSLLQNHNSVLPGDLAVSGSKLKMRTESSPSSLQQMGSAASTPTSETPSEDIRRPSRASLSRQPTLQELIEHNIAGAAQLNFGKTYKDLAHASRKSLPPGTDVFVKQGRQVYDGLNQGFWNFVEDIRQVTLGDEPVNGSPADQQRRQLQKKKSNKQLQSDTTCERHGRPQGRRKSRPGDEHKPEKDQFWKEFGIETPKGTNKNHAHPTSAQPSSKDEKHSSKSSTDSQHPPSLLADLMDVNEDDEAWDNWPVESPVAHRRVQQVNIRRTSVASEASDEDGGTASPPPQSTTQKQHAPHHTDNASWAELTS